MTGNDAYGRARCSTCGIGCRRDGPDCRAYPDRACADAPVPACHVTYGRCYR